MVTTFVQDLRVGLRVLLREKGFCAMAIAVLALGICGVTTTFSVVNGVMLRGFSFPNSARLVSVNFIDPTSKNFFGQNGQISAMDFEEVRPQAKSYELMSAYINGSTVNATIDGTPRRYTGAYVTPDFLRILGVAPSIGRDLRAEDNAPGAEKVAIIGYGLWQRDFGGTQDIVGKGLRINGTPATIVGVMPKGFAFPINEELWIPLYSEFPVRERNNPRNVNPGVVALLKPGVSLDQANAEATTLARRLAEAYPETNKQFNTGKVEPLLKTYTPLPLRGTLLTMLAFCVGLLLIGCVNVMNMQFARATLRARELAIRSSLGASRTRLIFQMLTESLLVTVVGTAVGVGLAYYCTDLLNATVRNFDNPPPSWITFDIDGPVLGFSIVAMLAAAIVSGLLPAWMASRANVVSVLKEGGRGGTSRGTRVVMRGLVVLQVVVTCVLLIGSLLQMQSILKQQTIDYGYDTEGLMSARMGLMDGAYPTQELRKTFFDRLVRELQAHSEFEAVALTNKFRMVFSGSGPIEIEGKEYKEKKDRPNANFEQVTSGYFEVLGQTLIEGRRFQDDDLDDKLPVAVVNAAFAHKHFGNESPLGRRFRALDGNTLQPGPWRTIVGVVRTVRMMPPFNIPNVDETGFYVPFYSQPSGPAQPGPAAAQFATVLVRPRGGLRADTLANALRREVAKVDPDLPLYYVDTPKRQIAGFVSQGRVVAIMFSIFGAVAMVIAGVGIYGVMSFSVNQRTQELGVRMALGADSRRILRMVLRQGSVLTGVGLALGLLITLGLAGAAGEGIQSVLFGVSPLDPLIYAAVAAMIAAVSLAASFVPARRATRVDPMIALRAE
ncbi:MAG TPA: ABC transporter permease [Candidatus Polarisedimenticolia bacterium]|jgi:predicted permease|nr:ABC transporter permease [Candidatus Polarisedimenticolia bacterium]